MSIPKSLLSDLERIPADRPVALLIRHAARFPITDPQLSLSVPLTEEGVRTAEALGSMLGARVQGGRLLAPAVERCLETANAIARGAGWEKRAQPDDRLSHAFILPAWDLVAARVASKKLPVQVRILVDLLLEGAAGQPRLDILATHDSVLGVAANNLLGAPVTGEHWPGYLEGLFAWREDSQAAFLWRGEEKRIRLVAGHAMEI